MTGPGRIIVIGDIVTDVVTVLGAPIVAGSDTPAPISVTGGGAGANTAAWLADAGVAVTLCGVVGDGRGRIRAPRRTVGGRRGLRRPAVARMPTGSIVILAGPADRTMITDRGANRCSRRPMSTPRSRPRRMPYTCICRGIRCSMPARADAARHALEAAPRAA